MNKKRIVVAIILNMILYLALARYIIFKTYDNKIPIFEEIQKAEVIIPFILGYIEIFYLLSLFHSLISNNQTSKIIDGLRLIFISTMLTIMVIRLCLVLPYNKTYDIYGADIYGFIVIPLLCIISILADKKKYNVFGLIYANIGIILYLITIVTLISLKVIDSPYKFIDVLNQKIYKSVINIVIIIAINTVIAGVIMLITRHKSVEKN